MNKFTRIKNEFYLGEEIHLTFNKQVAAEFFKKRRNFIEHELLDEILKREGFKVRECRYAKIDGRNPDGSYKMRLNNFDYKK